jgi:RND family efflux transporter MFP subunit
MTRLPPKLVWPLAVLATAFLAAAGLVAARPDVEQAPPVITHPTVRVAPAIPESLQLSVHTQGTVVPRTETDLVSEVSGRILWVSPSLASGGFVEPDEVLLRIDPSDYEIGVARAEAGLRRARSERSLALAGLERHRRLADRGVESTSALEAAVNAREVAEAAVIDAEATLEQARRDLERTRIKSPYLGRVRDKRVDVGQFVGRGAPIARLYAVDYAEVRLPLPDADAAFLDLPIAYRDDSDAGPAPEVILRAEFAGRTHTWRGHIVRTEGELDPRTRMIHAVARVEDPYGRGEAPDRPPLSVGLFVQAEILGLELDHVVRVPRSALRGDSTVVVVDAEGLIRLRDVDVLKRNRDEILVVGGLERGDRFCTTPLSIAVDGMVVETVEPVAAGSAEAPAEPVAASSAGAPAEPMLADSAKAPATPSPEAARPPRLPMQPGQMCPVHGPPCSPGAKGVESHVAAAALPGPQP